MTDSLSHIRGKAAPDGGIYCISFDMVETGIFYNKTKFEYTRRYNDTKLATLNSRNYKVRSLAAFYFRQRTKESNLETS